MRSPPKLQRGVMAEKRKVTLNITEEQFWAVYYFFNHSDWDFDAIITSEWGRDSRECNVLNAERESADCVPVQNTSDDSVKDSHSGHNDHSSRDSNSNGDQNSDNNDQVSEHLDRCPHCFLSPCVTSYRQSWLGQGAHPHQRNSGLRKKRYKKFWKLMSDFGAWYLTEYQNKKRRVLGRDEDSSIVWTDREIMPDCVLDLVRGLYPNLPDQPYMGHKWW